MIEITNIIRRNDDQTTVFYKIIEDNRTIEENAHFQFSIDNIDKEIIREYLSNRLEQFKNRPQINYEELIGEVIE